MAPEWLKVPAADRAVAGCGMDAEDAVWMSRRIETVPDSAPGHAATRPGQEWCRRDALSRLVVFVSDPRLAEHLRSSPAAGVDALVRLSGVNEGPAGSTCALGRRGVEVVDAGMLAPMLSNGTLMPGRCLSDWGRIGRSLMEPHALDVCLSIGRHAAERAKLAGCRSLHAVGLAADWLAGERLRPWQDQALLPVEGARCHPPGVLGARESRERELRGGYDLLRARASFGLAALVGALLASAQMGIRAHAWGRRGREAVAVTLRLNPGARAWITAVEAQADDMQEGRGGGRAALEADLAYRSLSDSSSAASEVMAASE